jgi:hypothetical protein
MERTATGFTRMVIMGFRACQVETAEMVFKWISIGKGTAVMGAPGVTVLPILIIREGTAEMGVQVEVVVMEVQEQMVEVEVKELQMAMEEMAVMAEMVD